MKALVVALSLLASGCRPDPLDGLARDYAELVRGMEGATRDRASALLARVEGLPPSRRASRLELHLEALLARLEGPRLSFDEESRLLYGVVAPRPDEEEALRIRGEIDRLLPGAGSLHARYLEFQKRLLVPAEKLELVLERALEACRSETRERFELPPAESLRIEMVSGRPWPSFSRYLGDHRSLLQVSRDFPLPVPKVLEIAAHEAYPGHHTLSVMLEEKLVRGRGLAEFSVHPPAGPDALLREGLATIALELLFTPEERLAIERDVLFPLAGVDPREAELHSRVERLVSRLQPLAVEAARLYLDGERDRVQAAILLENEALVPDPWSFLRFVDRHRTYVVAYTAGADAARRLVAEKPSDPWGSLEAALLDNPEDSGS